MLEAWPAELQSHDVDDLDRRGLCDAAEWSARMRAGLDAFDARIAARVTDLDDGGAGAATVFRSAGRCSQREADRRARRADALRQLPTAAEALGAGLVTAEHVDALARAADDTSPQAVEASGLLDKATNRPADLLAKDARDWTRREISNEALEERHRRQRASRTLSMYDNHLGMTVVHGEFDSVTGAEITAAINSATDRLFRADGGREGAAEVRTPEQRRADAVAALLTGGAEPAPTAGPPAVRNQMLVVAHADGTAEIPHVGPLPRSEVERLMCVSDIYGLLFSGDGQPLWHGDRVRLATDDQWRGLVARDGGCRICDAHPSRCEAHHIVPSASPANGPTDIDNLILLCKFHHHTVHDLGYRLVQAADGSWRIHPPP